MQREQAQAAGHPTELMELLHVTSVVNLKASRTLALDHDFAVQRAQLDLANVSASAIDLVRDQRRAL